jgi:hypothetical protein
MIKKQEWNQQSTINIRNILRLFYCHHWLTLPKFIEHKLTHCPPKCSTQPRSEILRQLWGSWHSFKMFINIGGVLNHATYCSTSLMQLSVTGNRVKDWYHLAGNFSTNNWYHTSIYLQLEDDVSVISICTSRFCRNLFWIESNSWSRTEGEDCIRGSNKGNLFRTENAQFSFLNVHYV